MQILLVVSCIQIMNLQKVYETKGGKCTAVNSLELTLFENQILALLGKFYVIFITSVIP